MPTTHHLMILASLFAVAPRAVADDVESVLDAAGGNREELASALERVPDDQRFAMEWLITRMPDRDRGAVDAEFLLEHVDEACQAWRGAPWRELVPREVFLDAILPYACVSETREAWRDPMRELAAPMIEGVLDPAAAAVRINQRLFPATGVKYSTKRARADQSPSESIASGLASCTGLSILLIDACRSVGIPARFVGVPMWTDGSGNHSWVEIWDGERWRFTGAAEPSGDRLDEAWFTGRARTAIEGDPEHGIFAVSWSDSPLPWPIGFDKAPPPGRAIDVTSRYLDSGSSVPDGHGRLRVRVSEDGERVSVPVRIAHAFGGANVEETKSSKDERFDANDHVEFVVPIGAEVSIESGEARKTIRLDRDETLVTLERAPMVTIDRDASRRAIEQLAKALETAATTMPQPSAAYATVPLTAADAARAKAMLVARHGESTRRSCQAELESGRIELGDLSMPIWYRRFGDAPFGERSLFISMHGGGGAPPRVNTSQWENQKRLYSPDEGIYLAPRAPTDTWNLWHRDHIDRFFDRIIAGMVAVEGVDPDRIYLMGYSAGGDGVYQLAPRMADRLAAAAMMAGHPNETRPDGLRNLPFAIWMGADDGAYSRNDVARRWGEELSRLRTGDPTGYPHSVHLIEGKGHWMDREDAAAVPWMASHVRDVRPERVVWLQDDVVHPRFYWLAVESPQARAKTVVSRTGQRISIEERAPQGELRIRLDDAMVDLDEEIVVAAISPADGTTREVFRGRLPRTIETISKTLLERNDPAAVFTAELVVPAAAP